MDEEASNNQNLQTQDRNIEQLRWSNFQAFDGRLPSMPTIPTATDMPTMFPPNWHPGSSFQFVHPPGVPYNLYMAPTSSTENVMPGINHNMPFSQVPSQSQSFDTQPSQKSSRRNQIGGAKTKEHWTVDEDVELCVAWLNISEDSVIGTSQRQARFWDRVTDKFNELMKDKLRKHTARSKDAAQSRWGTIHPSVTKWSGLHATLTRNLESGWTVEDMESKVRAAYQSKYKEVFKFEKCWKVLRDNYKWKTWLQETKKVHQEGIQPVSVPPTSQQYKEYVAVDSESPSNPCTETPVSMCPPIHLERDKEKNPHITGPASRDMPRPDGGKKVMNQKQKRKQQFIDQETVLKDTISAALTGVEAKAEERFRRQEELKRRRDDILDQRYEEQKLLAKKEHELAQENRKTQILKDFKYVSDQLIEASKDLGAINQSSLVTPHERFEYEMKRKWVEMLQSQLAAKERKLLLATSPVQSPVTRPSASAFGFSTSKITPRCLDNEDWETDHNV